jgi:HSP20 family protein
MNLGCLVGKEHPMALPDIFKPSRSLRRREPESSFMRPFEDMRRLMEDFWMALFGGMGRFAENFIPSVDVKEEDDQVVVAAELPGLDKSDVDVEVTQDSVRIAGEKRKEEKKQEKGYYHCETSYGAFERIIDLPAAVDEDKAKAEFSKGVLTIVLPKSEQARAKRTKVEVKSA